MQEKRKGKLNIIIRDRENILFEGSIKAVTSRNEKGIFDVLAEHESFISLIKEFLIVHHLDGAKKEIKLEQGIIKVYKNTINVFLGL